MIILDAITRKLQVLLNGAATTTELPLLASWVDVTTTTYVPGSNNDITTGATAVDLVAAPSASTYRQVKLLTVFNADTVSAVVTLRYNDNGTTRILVKTTLAVGDTLVYTDGEGFRVITLNGAIKSSGSGASTFLDLTDTPTVYTGAGLDLVRVNTGETALEFVDPTTLTTFEATDVGMAEAQLSTRPWEFILPGTGIAVTIEGEQGDALRLSAVASEIDHGGLAGLTDDDHAAYLLASDATNRATFAANWTDLTDTGSTTLHSHTTTADLDLIDGTITTQPWETIIAGSNITITESSDGSAIVIASTGGGVTDHGALTGLADDDHTQYLLASDATDRSTFATNWTDLTDGGATVLHSHSSSSEATDVSHVDGTETAHIWERILAGSNITITEIGAGEAISIEATASGGTTSLGRTFLLMGA